MKHASAKVRNKVKAKFARSINQLERFFGQDKDKGQFINRIRHGKIKN